MPKVRRKKTHRARWTDANGRERQKSFHTAADARDWKRRVEINKADGVNIDHARRRLPVADWCRQVIDRKSDLGDLTVKRYRGVIHNQIDATDLGGLTLGRLRRSDVETWALELTDDQELAPRSVKKALDLLSSCMTAAVHDGIVTVNPCDGVKPPKPPKTEMLWLTVAEVDRLADAIDGHAEAPGFYSGAVRFLAYSGLRWGEMARLQVGDVDLLRRRVHVRRRAKTDAGYREVPIATAVDRVVRDAVAGKAADGLVFTTVRGAQLHQSKFRKRYKQALDDAGVDPDVRVHDLRHTCATWLIGNGADALLVSKWLGHSSVNTTLNVYAHLWPDKLDEAAAALDRMPGASVAEVHDLGVRRREA